MSAILLTRAHPILYIGAGELAIPVYATQNVADCIVKSEDEDFYTLLRKEYGMEVPKDKRIPDHIVNDNDVFFLMMYIFKSMIWVHANQMQI